jgi:hypothetical protein
MLLAVFFLRSSTLRAQGSGSNSDSLASAAWRSSALQSSTPDSANVAKFDFPTSFGLTFEHVLSVYRWGATAAYSRGYQEDSAHMAALTAGSTSLLFSGVARSRLQQETQSLTSEATGALTGDVSLLNGNTLGAFLGFYGTSYAISSSSDNAFRSIGLINKVLDGYGIGGLRFGNQTTLFEISAAGGIARQSQTTGRPFGSILQGAATARDVLLSEGELLQSALYVDERFFPDHAQRYSNDSLRVSLRSEIAGDGRNNASASIGLLRRDYFYTTDTTAAQTKQERTEISIAFADLLEYPIIPNFLGSNFRLEVEPRFVTRASPSENLTRFLQSGNGQSSLLAPSSISGLRIAAEGRLLLFGAASTTVPSSWSLSPSGFSSNLLMRYEEKDENVSLRSADLPNVDPTQIHQLADALNQASYGSKLTQVLLAFTYQPSLRDILSLEIGSRIYRYDTPNLNNHDDRDELLSNMRAQYSHTFSQDLSAAVELRLSRSHLVYLESDRSAQNNVTQTIALATQALYQDRNFAEQLRGEVFANYTNLDYADLLPALETSGSYLLRGIQFHDSTLVDLGHMTANTRTDLELHLETSLFERGFYNASQFSERRDSRNIELSGDLTFGFLFANGEAPCTIKAGARAFVLVRSGIGEAINVNQDWTEQEQQIRIGPTVNASLDRITTSGPRLYGEFWYAFVRTTPTGAPPEYSKQVESRLTIQWTL